MSYSQILNWGNINKLDFKSSKYKSIQSEIYLDHYKKKDKDYYNQGLFHWRNVILDKFEIFQGKKISGNILEIGAGSAVSSGYASKFKSVKKVYALDSSIFAVKNLMPYIHKSQNAKIKKIRRVYGTFNNLSKCKINFNLIWGTGAFHNSKDLQKTFSECYKKLNNNGYLLISDMCEPDFSTHCELNKKNNKTLLYLSKKLKKKITFKTTSDYFRPLNEYIYFAKKTGFEVAPYIFSEEFGVPASDNIFLKKEIYRGMQLNIYNPYFKKIDGMYDPMLLICKKTNVFKKKTNFINSSQKKIINYSIFLSPYFLNKINFFFFRVIRKLKVLLF